MRNRTWTSAAAVGLLAASGLAQSLFVPAGSIRDPAEANSFSNYPLMRERGVWQTLIAQSEIGAASATLSKIAFRYDGPSFGKKGGVLQSFEIWMGPGVTPEKSSPIFASNWSAPPTRVVAVQNLAFAADTSVNPEPWGGPKGELAFQLAQPYAYQGGTLVVELRFTGNSNSGPTADNCLLDAEFDPWVGPTGGTATYRGQGCNSAVLDVQGILAPSGQISCAGSGLGLAGVCTLGAQALDVKLDAFGAPLCALYNDILVSLIGICDAQGSLPHHAATTWPIPSDPALASAALRFQILGVKPSANRLGVVTTQGADVVLGTLRPLWRKYYSYFHHTDERAAVAAFSAPAVLTMKLN
jgi:hypothetical protein